jgi:hypothetical protein
LIPSQLVFKVRLHPEWPSTSEGENPRRRHIRLKKSPSTVPAAGQIARLAEVDICHRGLVVDQRRKEALVLGWRSKAHKGTIFKVLAAVDSPVVDVNIDGRDGTVCCKRSPCKERQDDEERYQIHCKKEVSTQLKIVSKMLVHSFTLQSRTELLFLEK